MKFIYTNDKYEELGVLKNSSIDFEIGKYDVASNDYQMSISIGSWNREFDKGSLRQRRESRRKPSARITRGILRKHRKR